MKPNVLLIAPLMALSLAASGAALGAAPGSDSADATPNVSGAIQDGHAPAMGHWRRGGMRNEGWTGMRGMMADCPMMGIEGGPNSKVMMQMHGEMMRAMGDIMMKYADKLETPATSK